MSTFSKHISSKPSRGCTLKNVQNKIPILAKASRPRGRPRKFERKEKDNPPDITSMIPKKRNTSPGEYEDAPPKKVNLTNIKKSVNHNIKKPVNNISNQIKLKELRVHIVPLKVSKVEVGRTAYNIGEDQNPIKYSKSNAETDVKVTQPEPTINFNDLNNEDERSESGTTTRTNKLKNETVADPHSNGMTETNVMDSEKCDMCGQYINNSDIVYYQGHPQNSEEEFDALTNEKLISSAGNERDIMGRPNTNITGFSIYDEHGHLCPLDCGLVKSNIFLNMSGYLKSISSDSADIDEESVPVRDVGPIIEWYAHGFEGGRQKSITVATKFGEYNLLNPSTEYAPLMNNLYEKIWLSKAVIEYLEKYKDLKPAYEDLLENIRKARIPEFPQELTEEILHKHAQFVCDEIVGLDLEDDDVPLITLPCMKTLIRLMGVKVKKLRVRPNIVYKKNNKKLLTKATTTPLVRKTFESFFTNQLDKTNHDLILNKERCGYRSKSPKWEMWLHEKVC